MGQYSNTPEQNDEVKQDDKKPADKTPFFGQNRKDEIRALLGQVVIVALGSHKKSLTAESARTDRRDRLNDVPSSTFGIDVGIQKDQ